MRTRKLLPLLWLFLTCMGLAMLTGCTKQARKARALERADRDFAAQQYARAEIEYLSALKFPPPTPAAFLRLGEIYSIQGKYTRAYAYLHQGLELEPDHVEARARLADVCLRLGQPKAAREEASRVLDKQPNEVSALLVLVEATTATNQVAETLRRLTQASAGAEKSAGYHVAQGMLQTKLGELAAGEVELKKALEVDVKSIEAYLALATLQMARTNLVEAEAAFKKAVDLAPPRSRARLLYAEFKVRNGARDEARKMIEELTRSVPDYVPAWLFLAQLDFVEQKSQSCKTLVEAVLVRDPVNFDGLRLKAELLMAAGEPANAIPVYQQILKTYGNVPLVQYRMAAALAQTRETAKAIGLLNDLIASDTNQLDAILLRANLQIRNGESSQAVAPLARLVRDLPQLYQAHALLADAYLAQSALDKAVGVYQNMATLFPKRPEVLLALGSLLIQQNNLGAARQPLETASQLAPDEMLITEKLVDLDLAEHKFEPAMERVRAATARKPDAGEPWLLSAKVHLAQALDLSRATNRPTATAAPVLLMQQPAVEAEVRAAETALLKSIQVNPQLRTGYLMLAQLYVKTGRQQRALDELSSLAKTNDVGALMQIGLIQSEQTNYPAARDAYERVLKLNPQFAPALNNLAFLYCERLGEPEKALDLAQQARQVLPTDPRTADTLGWVLYRKGDFSRALSLLQEGASKLPSETEMQFHLGMAYYMLGDEQSARGALRRALSGGNSEAWSEEAKQRLKLLDLEVSSVEPAKVPEVQAMLASQKNDPIALLRLGELLEQSKNYASAAESYATFLKTYTQNSGVQFKLARLYAGPLNDPARALDLAKQAHSVTPDNAEATYLLGRLVYQQGDHAWALNLLQEAARKLPERSELLHDLAWSFYSVGRVSDAEETMKNSVLPAGAGQSTDATTFLALVAASKEFPNLQPKSLAEAASVLQNNTNYGPALYLKGLGFERDTNFLSAQKAYEQLLGVFPQFSPAIKRLADLYAFHSNDLQKAYELSSKARQALPQDPSVARTLGILSYRRSEYQRAAQLLGECLSKWPEDPEVHFYMGMAQYRLKDRTQSLKSLQRAIDLKLEGSLEAEARQALQDLKKNG